MKSTVMMNLVSSVLAFGRVRFFLVPGSSYLWTHSLSLALFCIIHAKTSYTQKENK
jgi:hypothetical protein